VSTTTLGSRPATTMNRSAVRRGIVVQQYPTASLDSPDDVRSVARRIAAIADASMGLVVVVQPMETTNEGLIGLARATSRAPDSREMDMLLATAEQICIALLAMALIEQGYEAVSFTGDEAGIVTSLCHTRARILRVCPKRVQAALEEGKVVIVAGSQGVSPLGEITTLEPGQRTTARALAAALRAETAEICDLSSELSGIR
jgi:aspartate kinase